MHVSNRLEIAAPANGIWSRLIRAVEWPRWYPNSSNVAIDGGGADLAPGVTFRWQTFGASLSSRVEEFEAPSRLAWSARGVGVDVYHAWVLSPLGGRTEVLTEESRYGFLARLDHVLRPQRMWKGHQLWLERLAAEMGRSSGGPDGGHPEA